MFCVVFFYSPGREAPKNARNLIQEKNGIELLVDFFFELKDQKSCICYLRPTYLPTGSPIFPLIAGVACFAIYSNLKAPIILVGHSTTEYDTTETGELPVGRALRQRGLCWGGGGGGG
jgi:hypothetical protein